MDGRAFSSFRLMLDRILRTVTEPALTPVAARLPGGTVAARVVAAAALLAGVGTFATFVTGRYLVGLALMALCLLLVVLGDTKFRKESRRTYFLRIVLDTLFWASIPFAFALADPSRALAALFLILGLLVSNSAWLAFGMIAARTPARQGGANPFVFPGGLIERTETFVALAIACLRPDWFGPIAYVLGILCFATAGMRTAEALVALKES